MLGPSSPIRLAPGVWLLTVHIDSLSLCAATPDDGVRSPGPDRLQRHLYRLSRCANRRGRPVGTGLCWPGGPELMLRPWRWDLHREAYFVLEARGVGRLLVHLRGRGPRFEFEFDADHLSDIGPDGAFAEFRALLREVLAPLTEHASSAMSVDVSRLDIAFDVALYALPAAERFVGRGGTVETHRDEHGRVTGYTAGSQEAGLRANYYTSKNRPRDVERRARAGYDPAVHGPHVQRYEFQIHDALLRGKERLLVNGRSLPTGEALLTDGLAALAHYAGTWLSLRSAANRRRTEPWWEAMISSVGDRPGTLQRRRSDTGFLGVLEHEQLELPFKPADDDAAVVAGPDGEATMSAEPTPSLGTSAPVSGSRAGPALWESLSGKRVLMVRAVGVGVHCATCPIRGPPATAGRGAQRRRARTRTPAADGSGPQSDQMIIALTLLCLWLSWWLIADGLTPPY